MSGMCLSLVAISKNPCGYAGRYVARTEPVLEAVRIGSTLQARPAANGGRRLLGQFRESAIVTLPDIK